MARLPTVFISHGAPTFASEPGQAGPRLAALGRALPKPAAVLIVSPHWMTGSPRVGTSLRPETVHDFGGFSPDLYRIRYDVAGHPAMAQRTVKTLAQAGWAASADGMRGLDHGAWVPMLHMYPAADVPVFQVSLPAALDADGAWALGEALSPLADDGVLIVGSGSLTHNLREFRQHAEAGAPYVAEFSAWVRAAVQSPSDGRLRRTLVEAPHAQRAHPTPEHFWPLLVAAGAAPKSVRTEVIDGGVTHGVLSMDAFGFHPEAANA